MTIQDLGSLGEFVAAVATVATLARLGVQIRQNARATRQSAICDTVQSGRALRLELIREPEVAALYVKGLADPKSLGPEDLL